MRELFIYLGLAYVPTTIVLVVAYLSARTRAIRAEQIVHDGGSVVNVSSVGAQAHPPRFSAYVASKAALEGFTRVASSELLGDGITFTTIHMPLVKTAMSAPTKHYESMKGLSPEQAGEMVVRALEKKPATIDTKTGTITQVMAAIAPRLMNTVLHAYFLAFPDSGSADQDISRQEVLSRSALALSRLAPGVHW